MNSQEINIANSLTEEALNKSELDALKKRLGSADNYTLFLDTLFSIVIGKNNSITLFDYLTLNGLAEKFFFIQNKSADIIEELADFYFHGYNSENVSFLIETNNSTFLNHLDFLKNTKTAIVSKERIGLKKKFEKLDKLNEFDLFEDDIKNAITIRERAHLKKHLKELANITGGKIIAFNFKALLKYAAVVVFIIGPAIFFINRFYKNRGKQDFANNTTLPNVDTTKNAIQSLAFNIKLPEAESYSGETILLDAPKMGFASNDASKVGIAIHNVAGQISFVKKEYDKQSSDNEAKAKFYKSKLDSLNTVNDSYTFEKNTLHIFSIELPPNKEALKSIKLLTISEGNAELVYAKIKTTYYLIKLSGTKNKLKKEANEDILDRLKNIEKLK